MNNWAVGLTTFNRRNVLDFTLSQFRKYGGDIIIIDDGSPDPHPEAIVNKERLGVAKAKNKCISLLKDYKYIFLFDDDCFPYKDKWWEVYISASEKTNIHHFAHALKPHITVAKQFDDITYWNGALGCAMMIDDVVLEKCGGFDSKFGFWGYEHAEYTQRIYKMGVNPWLYITPNNISDYIWSFDAQGSFEDFTWAHKSSISEEEKAKCASENSTIYWKQTLGYKKYD